MPIKIDLHDNTSEVKVKPKGQEEVNIHTGAYAGIKRLENLIATETLNRIAGDNTLQAEIDAIVASGVKYLYIDELENGQIIISLLDITGRVVDSKSITLTEKIIKSAVLDEENQKLVYTCNDDSTIELDISALVGDIEEAIEDLRTELKEEIAVVRNNLSILTGRVDSAELQLSVLENETIPAINSELSIINQNLTEIDEHLDLLDSNVAVLDTEMAIVKETKVETNLGTSGYVQVNPKNMTQEQIQGMLVYVSNNGIPSYAKLNELGYSRVADYNTPADLNKVSTGDLMIDME